MSELRRRLAGRAANGSSAPAGPAEKPATDNEDALLEAARAARWANATKDTRDAIKWLATAIGAAAAVAFGAGPVLATTTYDFLESEWWRVVLYIVAALVGAMGAAYVVWVLLQALVPLPLTVDQLPKEVIESLNLTEDSYPYNIKSFDQFVNSFQANRTLVVQHRQLAAEATNQRDKDLWNKRAELDAARLRRLRRAEATIVERAQYELTRASIMQLKWRVFGGIFFAVLGVAVFQLVISGSNDGSDNKEESSSSETTTFSLQRESPEKLSTT